MRTAKFIVPAILFFVLSVIAGLNAESMLSTMFGDNMVLQREISVPVWGTAEPKEKVVVSFNGQEKTAVCDKAGRWMVMLDSMKAGGPFEMTVSAGKKVTVLKNVMIGEVWLCSGQSNMEMNLTLWQNKEPPDVAKAVDPDLRLFTVKKATSFEPITGLSGNWQICDPGTAKWFSAVGYYFGAELRKKLKVPVGLIHSSWGGTPAEAWTSGKALASDPEFKYLLDRLEEQKNKDKQKDVKSEIKEWELKNFSQDTGIDKKSKDWARLDFDDSSWELMNIPGAFEDQGLKIDGAVWFRTKFELPSDWPKGDLTLDLGPIDDFDQTFVNGIKVGATGEETPNYWQANRSYTIPAKALNAGFNVIAVRVFDHIGNGGIVGSADQLRISSASDKTKSIPLAGKWKYKVEKAFPEKDSSIWSTYPQGAAIQNSPTVLYNAMIAPILPFAIRGAIWYQGESNADRAYQYRKLFPLMIKDWRSAWGYAFPFLFVQLANYTERKSDPAESDWAELREAQSMTLSLTNTGMAVIIDIGDAKDIHPKNKRDVGYRLSLAALAKAYGQNIVYSGPVYDSMTVENGTIRLKFRSIGAGLVAKGGSPTGFQIAGSDRKFVWASAKIEKGTIVVFNQEVKDPVAVRYAWANNPDCNLYNIEGLPASPFRTDDWPGVTAGKK